MKKENTDRKGKIKEYMRFRSKLKGKRRREKNK